MPTLDDDGVMKPLASEVPMTNDHKIAVSKLDHVDSDPPTIKQIRTQYAQSTNETNTQTNNQPNNSCPQEHAFATWYLWPSLLIFSWLTPLLSVGVQRPLQMNDVGLPWKKERSDECQARFDCEWNKEVERVRLINQSTEIKQSKDLNQTSSSSALASSPSISKPVKAPETSEQSVDETTDQTIKPSLTRVAWRLVRWDFFLAAILQAYGVFDQLIGPQILKRLTQYSLEASVRDLPPLDGYQWALYLFGSAVVSAISRALSAHYTARIFIRLRNMLILAVYQKSLRLPIQNRKDGQINNMMSADSQKIVELAFAVHYLWSAPIIIAVGLYQLWIEVGWVSMLGLAVMLLFLPVAGTLMGVQMGYQAKASAETDKRIALVTEIIQGIKVIKLSAWTKPFLKSLDDQRDKELVWLKKFAWLQSFTFGSMMLVPVLMSVTIFGARAGIGGDMSPPVVFTTLALVNIIKMPLSFLPMSLGSLAQVLVAIGRMGDFMNLPEIIEQRIKLDHVGVVMTNAEFTWGEPPEEEKKDISDKSHSRSNNQQNDQSNSKLINLADGSSIPTTSDHALNQQIEQQVKTQLAVVEQGHAGAQVINQSSSQTSDGMTINNHVSNEQASVAAVDDKSNNQIVKQKVPPRLTDINLSVKAGELTLVLGKVGAGKSTLLYGMLNEVEQSFGTTSIGGQIAYVPQTAFIVNASLRDNVVFGEVFDADRYEKVIHACALIADINLLPNGDLTEIGERGINLSGGQKQRVSIARAAYNTHAQVVLLDDPLSAVDMHVAQHIFTHCLNGLMKDRLRVLVTHSMAFIDQADQIVLLKETQVKDCYTAVVATPREMRDNDREFQMLLDRYHAGTIQSDDEEAAKSREKNKKSKAAKENQSNVIDKTEAEKKADLVEEEERGVGEISWDVYFRYIKAGGSSFFYVSIICFFLLVLGAQIGADFVLSEWSNDLIDGERSIGFWLGLYAGMVGISVLFMICRTTTVAMFGIRASRKLHHDLAQSVMNKSMSWFDKTPSGRVLNRFSKDMYIIDLMMAFMSEYALSTTLDVLGIVIVIAIIVPIALAMFALLAILYVLVANYFRRANRDLQRLESVSRTPIFSHFAESLSGMASIRACQMQKMYGLENKSRVNENTRFLYFSQAVSSWLQVRLDLIGSIIIGGSAVLAVASPNIDGAISAGSFGLLLTYALNSSALLNASVVLLSQVEAQMNSVERVDYYSQKMDQETNKSLNPAINESVHGGHWPPKGHISIKNLQMRYRDDLDLVLKGIDLEIPASKRVGIVGRTGSGKSSLLVALFRLVEPCGGSIVVDGVDLSQIDSNEIRSHFSIIPQDAFLFQGTFKYNLDPHGLYTDEELWSALEYVQLKGVVERMPSQLLTPITETGNNLSTGQKQLLCMARALLKRPKLICLDEATASVDLESDFLIQSVIRTQFAGSTVLTIAHRLNTILDYDLIVVMENGLIAELGTPDELIQAHGIFASMLHDKKDN